MNQPYSQPSPNPSLWEGKRTGKSREEKLPEADDMSYRGGLAITTLLEQVKELRKNQTPAEKIFWEVVRAKRFLDLKFRRQHQIGNYIVDFYCHKHKLVIELDGEIHNLPEQQERDRQRTQYLKSLGINILRFTNQEILENLKTVLEKIIAHLSPSTSGRGARGEGTIGDRKGGVLWHTQGSGKSLSMVFLAGKLVLDPHLQNPTIVVLTDRNDLDDQLFDTFAGCHQLLRQDPQQANNREQLRELLNRNSGGIIFTTVNKFSPADNFPTSGGKQRGDYPQISARRNIIVLADEAHRSQYGFKAKQVNIAVLASVRHT